MSFTTLVGAFTNGGSHYLNLTEEAAKHWNSIAKPAAQKTLTKLSKIKIPRGRCPNEDHFTRLMDSVFGNTELHSLDTHFVCPQAASCTRSAEKNFFKVNITLFGGVTNVTHHVYDSPVIGDFSLRL